MRGFKEKIEWQRKILESVNSDLPKEQQLPGLTEQVFSAWEATFYREVNSELRLLILRASELTQSINDFSTPVKILIEDIQQELEQLCIAIRDVMPSLRSRQSTHRILVL